MKSKIITSSLLIGSLLMTTLIKVDVCHNVDNNPHVINIALPAAVAHLIQHPSDSLGQCGENDDTPNK